MPIPFAQRLSERLLTGPTSREAMQRAMERQREESEAYRRGDITQTELGLRTAGNIADASVGNIVGQLVEPVMPIVETAMDAGGTVTPVSESPKVNTPLPPSAFTVPWADIPLGAVATIPPEKFVTSDIPSPKVTLPVFEKVTALVIALLAPVKDTL